MQLWSTGRKAPKNERKPLQDNKADCRSANGNSPGKCFYVPYGQLVLQLCTKTPQSCFLESKSKLPYQKQMAQHQPKYVSCCLQPFKRDALVFLLKQVTVLCVLVCSGTWLGFRWLQTTCVVCCCGFTALSLHSILLTLNRTANPFHTHYIVIKLMIAFAWGSEKWESRTGYPVEPMNLMLQSAGVICLRPHQFLL